MLLKALKGTGLVSLLLFLAIPAHAEEHVVKIITDFETGRMYFDPKIIQIKKDDTVTWINQEATEHNMVTYPDGFPKGERGFESPYLDKKGQKWSYAFRTSGSYEYHCIPHVFMGMHGMVIVDRLSKPHEQHVPTSKQISKYRNKMLEYYEEDDLLKVPDYDSMEKKVQENSWLGESEYLELFGKDAICRSSPVS